LNDDQRLVTDAYKSGQVPEAGMVRAPSVRLCVYAL